MGFNASDFKYNHFLVSEVEEGLVHLQFNNPKTLNAFSESIWRDYQAILEKLDRNPDTNVILISSTVPKAFSSGLDLKDAMKTMGSSVGLPDKQRYSQLHEHIRDFQYSIGTPARINTPTIALLNGINYGLALDIAAACSIRVAVSGARFSIREIKIGIPADIGSLQRLPSVVNNKSLLYQYALTGSVFGAEEALLWGLVSAIVPTLREGVEYIKSLGEDINGNQQWAIKGTKKSIQNMLDGTTTEQGLKDIADYNASNINGEFLKALGGVKL